MRRIFRSFLFLPQVPIYAYITLTIFIGFLFYFFELCPLREANLAFVYADFLNEFDIKFNSIMPCSLKVSSLIIKADIHN